MKDHCWRGLVCLISVVVMACSLAFGDQITQVVTFSREALSFQKVGGYDLVTGNGCTTLNLPGKPQLPVLQTSLAIPPGARVTEVTVVARAQEALAGSYFILPTQAPRPYGDPGDRSISTGPDPAVYGLRNAYPGRAVELVGQSDIAGQALAALRIYPLQYRPAERRLLLNSRLELVIRYTMDGPRPEKMNRMSERTRNLYEAMVKGMVLNPEAVVIEPGSGPQTSALPAGDYDHVVITSNALRPNFAGLVTWNKKKGVPDTVVTTEYIYANYSGADNQEKIRNFVKDANTNWGTIWFLLGGDVSVVPVETKYFSITGENVPGDNYYGDFDDDWTCEVFVARASVENSSEASVFLDKVLTYEKTPPAGYAAKALLMGFDADYSTHCEQTKEIIDNSYIPANFTVAKVYDSYGGNHETDAVNYLNAGQNLVNHADHGSYDFMGIGYYHHSWGLYSSDMDALTNGDKQSILYSLACDVNGFDQGADCIGEHFVHNANGGGVAYVGNTRYGWYTPGSANSLSNFYDIEWWRSLFAYNMYHLGQALADSKNRNLPGSDNYLRYIVWELSTLGEPEMAIWTANPTAMTVSHPATIPVGSQSFTVTVTYSGAPEVGALVCVWKGSEVYAYGATNSSGQRTFTIDPLTPGTMDVTVTAQNHLPYEGLCSVGGLPAVTLTLNRTSSDPHHRGGSLTYDATFTNNTASTQEVYYWAVATMPNSRTREVLAPELITVPVPSYMKSYTQTIPTKAPYGTSTYTGYISTTPHGPVMGQSSFTLDIQAAE